jgi:hypothetical protein
MAQGNAYRADNDDAAQPGIRPVAKFKYGAIAVDVWPNQTENGSMCNTTISYS